MTTSFLFYLPAWLLAIIILLIVLLFMWIGAQYRRYEKRRKKDLASKEFGSLENLMLGLLGLLLAFTFGMALDKFADRRRVIVEEANAIGTAVLRADLYPDSIRSVLRKDFEHYIEWRIAYYDAGTDEKNIKLTLDSTEYYSNHVWKLVISASHDLDNRVRTSLMVPAVNEVIDIVTTRDESRLAKVPPPILIVLLLMTATGSFLVGYDPKEKNKILIFCFAFVSCLTLYIILELDHPRRGLINLDSAANKIRDLRNLFRE